MAIGIAAIARWKIVGAPFFWVAGASTLLVGGWSVLGGGPAAWIGVLALVVGLFVARHPTALVGVYSVAAVALVTEAGLQSSLPLAITGALALGGVTDEMLLGHWYLVDPTMPRWALKRLDVIGAAALAIDGVLLLAAGATVGTVVGWAFVALLFMSVLLMIGVWFSLKEPSYPGVMAATGLSYLAVLTALGATVAGRSLIGDIANQLAEGILRG